MFTSTCHPCLFFVCFPSALSFLNHRFGQPAFSRFLVAFVLEREICAIFSLKKGSFGDMFLSEVLLFVCCYCCCSSCCCCGCSCFNFALLCLMYSVSSCCCLFVQPFSSSLFSLLLLVYLAFRILVPAVFVLLGGLLFRNYYYLCCFFLLLHLLFFLSLLLIMFIFLFLLLFAFVLHWLLLLLFCVILFLLLLCFVILFCFGYFFVPSACCWCLLFFAFGWSTFFLNSMMWSQVWLHQWHFNKIKRRQGSIGVLLWEAVLRWDLSFATNTTNKKILGHIYQLRQRELRGRESWHSWA